MLAICSEHYIQLYTANPGTIASHDPQEKAINSITTRLDLAAQNRLKASISPLETTCVLLKMTKKSPWRDGVVLEFFLAFWDMFGQEHTTMIHESVISRSLPPEVTTGIIALIYKWGPSGSLINWLSIILLNLNYKIFAKALQLQIQPILMNIISMDQSTRQSFLHTRINSIGWTSMLAFIISQVRFLKSI